MSEITQNNVHISKWKILNATNIKIIAIVLMFLDHVHQMYASIGAPSWLKMLGRPVFVMFLFMSAESFHYTRSRKKYLMRLLFASWIMLAGNFIIPLLVPSSKAYLDNNAFSTFFLVAVYMQCWDWFIGGIKQKNLKMVFKGVLVSLIPILVSILLINVEGMIYANSNIPKAVSKLSILLLQFIPNVMTTEGGTSVVIMGLLFYIFRGKRFLQIITVLIFSIAMYFMQNGNIQWMMCFGIIPMILYNGQRGRNMKNLFYIFYPLHLWILYLSAAIYFGK